MNHLSEFDIEQLKAGAGRHQGLIALPREIFDILVRDVRRWDGVGTLGFPYNLKRAVKKV